jgi:hypothetical protein
MADGTPAGPADGLTPEQEEVRHLLADVRHSAPMPDDVADRLDNVLAELAAGSREQLEVASAPADGVVVSLASRRRRRAATALVAAAAAVAVGIGLGQVVGNGGGSENASVSAGEQADGGARDRARPHEAPERGAVPEALSDVVPAGALRIRPRHFSADVTRIRERLATLGTAAHLMDEARGELADCIPDRQGTLSVVPVRYGRRPAVLVFRRPRGDTQLVELLGCRTPDPVRAIVLPAP